MQVARDGRHRYYAIASADVAHAMEALGAIASRRTRKPLGEDDAICYARTCYDHLAGKLAIELADAFESRALIVPDGRRYRVTGRGRDFVREWQIDADELKRGRRAFAIRCLDWTERRNHLAGALGAAICERLLAERWIKRLPGTRAVRLTGKGAEELTSLLGRKSRSMLWRVV